MTAAELRERMSLMEMQDWVSYVEINGPINPMLRMEAAIARAVSPFVKGDKSSLMPWPKEPEREATIEDLMRILKPAPKKVATGSR